MAIDAYVGLPGHGKSYGVTEHVIIPSLKEGRHVVTNIPLERDEILADHGIEGSEVSQLPEDWHERDDMSDFVPHGCVLVLDELWRRWPAGLKANQALLADKSLLAEHRHRVDSKNRSMRIVLVTQDLSQLAAWVRILVEQTYKMTKLTAAGASKRFRVDIYRGAPTGQNIPKSQLIRQTFGRYRPEVWKYYQSATQSQTGDVGDESKADGRGNVWKSPFIIFSFIAPILFIPFFVWYVYGIFSGGLGVVDEEIKHENTIEPQVFTNPAPALQQVSDITPAPVSTAPALSNIWSVAGYMEASKDAEFTGKNFVILRSIAGLRYMPTSDCERLPDGYSWQCTVDGKIATPWTGLGSATSWADSGSDLAVRTATVASGATNSRSTDTIRNPSP